MKFSLSVHQSLLKTNKVCNVVLLLDTAVALMVGRFFLNFDRGTCIGKETNFAITLDIA